MKIGPGLYGQWFSSSTVWNCSEICEIVSIDNEKDICLIFYVNNLQLFFSCLLLLEHNFDPPTLHSQPYPGDFICPCGLVASLFKWGDGHQ